MNRMEMNRIKNGSVASKMWLVFGGLIAAGLAVMFLRETPAVRRELKLMRM